MLLQQLDDLLPAHGRVCHLVDKDDMPQRLRKLASVQQEMRVLVCRHRTLHETTLYLARCDTDFTVTQDGVFVLRRTHASLEAPKEGEETYL